MVTCQVFGRRAGLFAAEWAKQVSLPDLSESFYAQEEAFLSGIGMYPVEETNEMIAALQKACDQSLMIVRNEAGLTKCLDTIESLRAQLGRNTCAFSASSLANGLRLENMLTTARLVASAALARKESRGSHYRSDYPTMQE